MLRKKHTWLLVAALFAMGCSSDDEGGGSTSCAQNPWSCAAGTTCWATDTQGGAACLTSGSKQKGETCVNAVGQADCADGLFCFQNALTPADPATCRPFCDPSHPCPAGEACGKLQNFQVQICVSTGSGGAGGTSGSGGGAGSAGAAGSSGAAGSTGGSAGSGGAAGCAGSGTSGSAGADCG